MSPDAYYEARSEEYSNPQADAVLRLLELMLGFVRPRVLDLGCGAGLATSALMVLGVHDCVGVDRSEAMVLRYVRETLRPARVANFWDPLPRARTAIAAHSLHLCEPSRLWQFRWRLREAGVETLVVVSPLKRAADGLRMRELRSASCPSGPRGKTVWAWAFDVLGEARP